MVKDLNSYFDHTNLKPEATKTDIKRLCQEAKEHGFYAVCINSCYTSLAASELADCNVKVATVIGFPLGCCVTDIKEAEARYVCHAGTDEIDMVINVGALKEKCYDYVLQDIRRVVEIASNRESIVKVILETCLLSEEEIVTACMLSEQAGASFVKTSTGFGKEGAKAGHIKLMRKTVGERLKIKAAGGIRDLPTVLEMIDGGADRIGTSQTLEIITEKK